MLGEVAAHHRERADKLGADRADLAARLDATEGSLADVRSAVAELEARANVQTESAHELTERWDAANRDLRAIRATKTWRAHDRALPML